MCKIIVHFSVPSLAQSLKIMLDQCVTYKIIALLKHIYSVALSLCILKRAMLIQGKDCLVNPVTKAGIQAISRAKTKMSVIHSGVFVTQILGN